MAMVTILNSRCNENERHYSLTDSFALLVIYKASRKPLEAMTPRMVYKWYTVVYNVSFVVGLIGYIIVLAVFFGVAAIFNIGPGFIQVGVLFLSYGLYFGYETFALV